MNIQTYILPEWKKSVKSNELEPEIEKEFLMIGESMAEYLDRYMMRNIPKNWYEGWTRYQFPLHVHDLILDIHKVYANYFSEFVEKYRAGIKEEFSISNGEINKIQLLKKRYNKHLQEQEEELNEIRAELKGRRRKRDPSSKRSKPKKTERKIVETRPEPQQEQPRDELNHDYVYKKWMEMVESKPISKSYWHIHEYMSRYILEYAKENTDNGIVTKQVIDDFYADYSKGKRPKTLNHYSRVVNRFWEFYQTLRSEENEMEVW